MDDKELTILVQNEIEWRKKLWQKMEGIESRQDKQSIDIKGLKVKSGVWGFAAGMIPAIGVLLAYFAKKEIIK